MYNVQVEECNAVDCDCVYPYEKLLRVVDRRQLTDLFAGGGRLERQPPREEAGM